jgi:predicted nucleic acid-binding protein
MILSSVLCLEMQVMNPLRVYIDTSVFGGYYDREFDDDSRAFFRYVHDKKILVVVSDLVIGELSRAPNPVRSLLDRTIRDGAESLEVTRMALQLQEAYLKAGILGRKWENDAMHVALATVSHADVIASWNFKHLLDPRRSREFNGVNLGMGYGLISILSPSDIVHNLEQTK